MDAPREQGLVFGEVAEEYDDARPSYPHELFDAVMAFGSLQPGDAALEIGAGTGKATRGFASRGMVIHALEPSSGMARVLRATGVDVEESSFEAYTPSPAAYRLAFAAQAWHWVHDPNRYKKVTAALAPGGMLALFWNRGRPMEGALRADNDAAYEEHAPALTSSIGAWDVDRTLDEMSAAAFRDATKRVFTWSITYTTAEWLALLATHSDHRMLPDEPRERLHAAVGRVIDDHGGRFDATYDAMLFLATRT